MEIKTEDTIDNQNDRVLLEETFYVLTKKNCVFRVRLTNSGIYLIKESENNIKEQLIPIQDVIGCRCLRSKKQSKNCSCHQSLSGGNSSSNNLKVVEENSNDLDDTDISAYLYIYAYLLIKNNNNNKNLKRERTIITLRFRSFDKYEDNNKEAQRWRTIIKKLIKGERITTNHIIDFSIISKYKEDRRLLILCNPKSGPGKGRVIFQQKIVPILQEAEIPYDLHITKHANFAREFVRTCNIYQWTGIVVVGGDGIVFEVINGLFERSDWLEVTKTIPIGVIPGGSGNGLARSIAYYCSEPYIPSPTLPSALACVRNNCAKMDLVRVETTSQILYSFLSIGWGFLSDIDIESERLRVLGGQRFTIWSVARLITLRSYGGKLWYLPTDQPMEPTKIELPTNIGSSTLDLPSEVHLETQTGRQRLDSWYSAASRRSAYFSATGSSYQSTTESIGDGDNNTSDRLRMYGPAPRLPCLTAPLPLSTWKCIEGRFIMVHASYQTHLGEECLFAPDAKLNDGTIWLLIVHGNATRTQLLQFLLGLNSGAHLNVLTENGPIEFIPVKAFRIEPDLNEHGYITVDGEHVEYGPIQAEIFPELAKIMIP